MLTSIRNVFTGTPSPFALQSYPGFPYTDWIVQQDRYAELRRWYTGEALNELLIDSASGKSVDKYPIKINPIRGTCEKHTSVLLGNTLESIRDAGVPITFVPKGDDKEAAEIINDAIVKALQAAGGGQLFVSNGIISQYMGGCVFQVAWKSRDEENPIQVVTPKPSEFLAYPDGTNWWKLREVWFVREISWVDAKAYGYPVPELLMSSVMPSDVESSGYKYYYIEHWLDDYYRCSVNEMTIMAKVGDEEVPLEGKNPFEIVPFVYIPHIREEKFLGESLITEAVKGIVKEMNARNADIGDAISDDSHSVLAVRGIKGSLKSATLPDGRKVVDLGSAAGMGTGDTPPDLFAVRTQSASDPQLKFSESLDTRYRVEVKHPAVADGLDEGSQRSSLTLTTRMWPLQAHVELERINWTVGMLALAKIILKMCLVKNVYGVVAEHLKTPLIIKWATMLPRDREALVNEVAIRKKNQLISKRHGIELFGDVDNIDEEIELIDEEAEKSAELNTKNSPFGQSEAGQEKDTEPAAQNFLEQE